jgi:hypothetical protein
VDEMLDWVKDLIYYNEEIKEGITLEGATCLYLFEKSE